MPAACSYCLPRPAEIETRRRTLRGAPSRTPSQSAPRPPDPGLVPAARRPDIGLRHLAGRIDWDADPEALRHGDLAGLPPDAIAAIEYAAQRREIVAFALALGIAPVVAVIGLLAKSARGSSRSAGRLARAILKKASDSDLAAAMSRVGL